MWAIKLITGHLAVSSAIYANRAFSTGEASSGPCRASLIKHLSRVLWQRFHCAVFTAV